MSTMSKTKGLEEEIWSAISAFEQILEAMPNDRASLEALTHAYEQIGDHTRATEYAIRLGRVLLEEGDIVAATELVDKLSAYAAEDAGVADAVKELRALTGGGAEGSAAGGVPAIRPPVPQADVRMTFNMADELSFAWQLMEGNELTQEEYASVVQDLTEMSSGDADVTVSVLHALEARRHSGLERIIGYASRTAHTPIISPAYFDLKANVAHLVPVRFARQRGAFAFSMISKEPLVMVMNPFDQDLRKDVQTLTGQICHFFTGLPSEFDALIARAESIIAAEKAA